MIRLAQCLVSAVLLVDAVGFSRIGTGFGVFVGIISFLTMVLVWRWPQ
jgi:hypothetical protein